MKNKAKNIAKKYIAGILTFTLVGGVIHYADVLESHAQINATLPGIESIVAKYSASYDTYNILEIVADNSAASSTSIGWLIGGQEPVKYEEKVQGFETVLAKLPTEQERKTFVEAVKNATTNPPSLGVSVTGAYEEIPTDAATEASSVDVYEVEIKGKLKPNDSGKYRCLQTNPTYRKFVSEDAGKTRYTHVVKFESASEPVKSTADEKWYNLDFKKITGATDLEITESTADGVKNEKDVTDTKYKLEEGNSLASADLSDATSPTFMTAYEKKSLYYKGDGEGNSYSYYGYVVKGNPGSATTGDVSSGDVSGGDPIIENESFYIVKKDGTVIPWVCCYTAAGYVKASAFTDSENDIFVADFKVDASGGYSATSASAVSGKDGFYKMADSSYVPSENGAYVMVGSDSMKVVTDADTADWAAAPEQQYDFVPGDTTCVAGEIEIDYTVRYKSIFKNEEWFKKNVLDLTDEECNRVDIKVTTLSFAELCELVADSSLSDKYGVDLNFVNFVYLAGDYSNVNVTDAKKADAAVLKLAQMALGDDSNRIPFAIDNKCIEGNTKVAALSNFLLYQAKNVDKSITVDNIKNTTFSEDVTKGYLAANVYLSGGTFVNSDFLKEKTEEPYKSLYSDVYNTAKKENDLREWNGLKRDISEKITDATIARYIINWNAKRDTVKEAIHVLDVEPTGSYDDDIVIQSKVSSFINDAQYDKSKINVTHMASAEFIGKVEELNELYDMIYFGDNIDQLNVEGDTPVYNDTKMKGLVYTHTGDVYIYNKKDEDEENLKRLPNDSLEDNKDTYRGPGNDINSTRMEELKAYVKAGYVVVFADRYFKNADKDTVSVNTTAVDSNSYYYEFMKFVLEKDSSGNFLYWNKNVFTEKNLHDDSLEGNTSSDANKKKAAQQVRQESFRKYISMSKLSIRWEEVGGQDSKPVEYSYNDGEYTIKNKVVTKMNGSANMLDDDELIYTFSLHSDSAVSADAVTYDCKLFIDTNSDGRFAGGDLSETEDTEEIDNLSIYVYENGAWNSVDKSDGHYQLSINKTYRVEREIPGGYVGVLPWKIVFYNNNNTGIRTSESGYTAIKRDHVENIKILHLISDDKKGKDDWNNWNLTTDKDDPNYDPEVGALLEEVEDIVGFHVEIDAMKVSEISGQVRSVDEYYWKGEIDLSNPQYMSLCRQGAANIFSKYDMIIVGFADNYQFGTVSDDNDADDRAANLAVAEALKDYIDAGNSVLFTHDTTTYIESTEGRRETWYWGYEFNKALRATVGLDRFGTSLNYYSDKADSAANDTDKAYYNRTLEKLAAYDFDVVKEPNSTELSNRKEGLTRYTVVRYMYNHLDKLIKNKGGSAALKNDANKKFYFPVRNKLLYSALYTGDGNAKALFGTYGGDTQKVTQVNSGQITTYPFTIPETMTVANTHYQWLQPNMELDRDNDGKNDIVVWYCLSDVSGYDGKNNIYNLVKNDVVNNYYIYSMGNVTYSGVGHSRPRGLADSKGNPTYEKRLFINTMVAAYKQGLRAPSLDFTDDAGNDTKGVYVMFDSQNGMALDLGGGANNFSVNFHATDNNIVSGKDVRVEFFRGAKNTDTNAIEVSGIGIGKVVPITNNATVRKASDKNALTPVNVSKGTSDIINGRFAGSTYYSVQNGEKYIFSFSLEELGLFKKEDGKLTISEGINGTTIYARVTTVYDNGKEITESSIQRLDISPAELFELR